MDSFRSDFSQLLSAFWVFFSFLFSAAGLAESGEIDCSISNDHRLNQLTEKTAALPSDYLQECSAKEIARKIVRRLHELTERGQVIVNENLEMKRRNYPIGSDSNGSIDRSNPQIFVNMTTQAFINIIEDGRFKNSFSGGESMGFHDHEGNNNSAQCAKAKLENDLISLILPFKTESSSVNAKLARLRPVYGYIGLGERSVTPGEISRFQEEDFAKMDKSARYFATHPEIQSSYGCLSVKIKFSQVRDRVTWTIGDSMHQWLQMNPERADLIRRVSTGSAPERMSDFRWRRKPRTMIETKYSNVTTDAMMSAMFKNYEEVQIWGGVTRDDIEAAYLDLRCLKGNALLRNTVRTPEFLQFLADTKLPVPVHALGNERVLEFMGGEHRAGSGIDYNELEKWPFQTIFRKVIPLPKPGEETP